MKQVNAVALEKLLKANLLSPKNSERLIQVFYDATKIVYERQKRLNKPQLKMKEISSALLLAESLQSNLFHFDAVGPLAECFGKIDETAAWKYYEENVMGSVQDKFGRKITIDEDGIRSLYKEAVTGKHVVAPQNYEEGRGKRLPWIRHTLQNCESVYVSEEKVGGSFRRNLIYAAVASIPLQPKAQTSYYIIVIRQHKGGENKLVTAYSMFKRNRFLSIIEDCRMPDVKLLIS
jgi:hypothetical protein